MKYTFLGDKQTFFFDGKPYRHGMCMHNIVKYFPREQSKPPAGGGVSSSLLSLLPILMALHKTFSFLPLLSNFINNNITL